MGTLSKKMLSKKWGHFGIEEWAAYSSHDIIERLNAKLNGTPYQEGCLPDNWETLHYRRQVLFYLEMKGK